MRQAHPSATQADTLNHSKIQSAIDTAARNIAYRFHMISSPIFQKMIGRMTRTNDFEVALDAARELHQAGIISALQEAAIRLAATDPVGLLAASLASLGKHANSTVATHIINTLSSSYVDCAATQPGIKRIIDLADKDLDEHGGSARVIESSALSMHILGCLLDNDEAPKDLILTVQSSAQRVMTSTSSHTSGEPRGSQPVGP